MKPRFAIVVLALLTFALVPAFRSHKANAANPLAFHVATANVTHASSQQLIYIAGGAEGSISVIDLNSTLVVTTIAVSNGPYTLVENHAGTRLYTGNGDGTISVIDTASDSVIGTVHLPSPAKVTGNLAVSPDDSRVYAVAGDEQLALLNTQSDAVTMLGFNTTPDPGSVALSPDGTVAYMNDALGNTDIGAWNTSTGAREGGYYNLNYNDCCPNGLAVSPDGKRLYENAQSHVIVDDAVGHEQLADIATPEWPLAMAMSPDGNTIYTDGPDLATGRTDEVSLIDTTTYTATATINLGVNTTTEYGFPLAVSPDGSRLYVGNPNNQTIDVVDTANRDVMTEIPLGFAASSIVVGYGNITPSPTPTPTPSAPCKNSSNSGFAPDEQFCSSVSSTPSVSTTVDITRYYGNVCPDATGPYSIDPSQCQDTTSGPLAPGVIGTGVDTDAQVVVNVSDSVPDNTPVLVNGQAAEGGWDAARTEYVGSIPSQELIFPNLNLTSSIVQAPFPATNTIALGNVDGTGAAINWAQLAIRGTRPVVLVHGINIAPYDFGSSSCPIAPDNTIQELGGWNTWGSWTNGYLTTIGVPNLRPEDEGLTGSPDYTNSDARAWGNPLDSYEDNAGYVGNQINLVLKRYGVQKVNVVTHSFGGLDALYAINYLGAASKVNNLIMQAVPYVGTEIADFMATLGCGAYPAIQELEPDHWNTTQPLPVPIGSAFTVAGDRDVPSPDEPEIAIPDFFVFGCTYLGEVTCSIPNDTQVPVYSVQATGADMLGTVYDTHTQINQDQLVFDLSCPHLVVADGAECTAPSNAPAGTIASGSRNVAHLTSRGASSSQSADFGSLFSGQLSAGSVVTETFPVPNSALANVFLAWNQSVLDMTLIDPKGEPVTPVSANVVYTQTTSGSGGSDILYQLNNPIPGNWNAVITSTDPLSQPVNFTLGTSLQTTLAITVVSTTVPYQPGTDIPISVTLADAGLPLDGATVTATAILSGTTPISVSLTDTGDGVYSGDFGASLLPGTYAVNVAATGMDNGWPFAVTKPSVFAIATGNASFSGTYAEGTMPGAYGLISSLVITPTIQVTNAATYSVEGILTDAAGNVIGTAGATAALSPGVSQALSLSFDGSTIGTAGKSGPYQLRSLTLTDNSTGSVSVDDIVPFAYTTNSYTTDQFSRPLVQILPGTQDMGTNPDAQGRFQDLTIAFTATGALTDTYQVVATLLSGQGQYISAVTQSVQLSATPQQVALQFSGADIAAQGIAGPYRVVGVTLVPLSIPSSVANYPSFWVTQPYLATEFSPPPPYATSTPIIALTATGTANATPTNTPTTTPLPPTATSIPTTTLASPTMTSQPAPPTSTPVPSSQPTNTPVPARPTISPMPTSASAPPVATQTRAAPSPVRPPPSTSTPETPQMPEPPSMTPVSTIGISAGNVPPTPATLPTVKPSRSDSKATIPLTVQIVRGRVVSGAVLTISIRTGPHASIDGALEVTATRQVVAGNGKHRHRRVQTVVVYRSEIRGLSDRRGHLVVHLRLGYKSSVPVKAILTITAALKQKKVSYRTWIQITPPSKPLPLVVGLSPTNVIAGAMLTVRIYTSGHVKVQIVLLVTTIKVLADGAGKHRMRHTITLYQIQIRGSTDGHGQLVRHMRINYRTAEAVRAFLTITVLTNREAITQDVPLTILAH